MKVFSLFLKLLKSNIQLLIIYVCVFVGIISMSFGSNKELTEVSFEPNILLINEDKDNDITNSLISYIDLHSTIKESVAGNQDEALFYGDIVAIVRIPKGFGDKLFTDDYVEIETKVGSMADGYLFSNILNSFVSTIRFYYSENTISHDNFMENAINLYVENENKTQALASNNSSQFVSATFNLTGYVFLSSLTAIIALIMTALKPMDVRRRLDISSQSSSKRSLLLILCNVILGFVVFAICMGLTLILMKDYEIRHLPLILMNGILMMLVSVTFGYFLSVVFESKLAISAVTTIVSLGLAFITGMFVTQSMLSKLTFNLGRIFPTHWFVRFNESILEGKAVSNSEIFKEMGLAFGIQIAYILLFMTLSIFLSQRNKTKES